MRTNQVSLRYFQAGRKGNPCAADSVELGIPANLCSSHTAFGCTVFCTRKRALSSRLLQGGVPSEVRDLPWFCKQLSCLHNTSIVTEVVSELCSKVFKVNIHNILNKITAHLTIILEIYQQVSIGIHLYWPLCLQIPPNSQGLIEYRSHPFWDQKYCPSHERDGRKRCCSCDRIEVCSGVSVV